MESVVKIPHHIWILFNITMQSLFHPVWLSPKGNHVRFHWKCLKKPERSTGVSTPPLRLPPKCNNSRTGNTAPSQAQGRLWGGTGTVPSFILPVFVFHIIENGSTMKDPRIFIMFAWVHDSCVFLRSRKKTTHQISPIIRLIDRTGLSDSNPIK